MKLRRLAKILPMALALACGLVLADTQLGMGTDFVEAKACLRAHAVATALAAARNRTVDGFEPCACSRTIFGGKPAYQCKVEANLNEDD